MKCEQELCPSWTGHGCICEVSGGPPLRGAAVANDREAEGWASYAAEQERHAETAARLELMTREARLSREAAERAVASRYGRHDIERALRAVDVYDDVASDEDVIFHDGAMHAVRVIRDMLGLDA